MRRLSKTWGREHCLPRHKQAPIKLRLTVRDAANGTWFKSEPLRQLASHPQDIPSCPDKRSCAHPGTTSVLAGGEA